MFNIAGLSLVSDATTCICLGDVIRYTCTAVGGEATLWRGTVLDSDCEITLNHSRFSDAGVCDIQDISGRSLEQADNCYTSELEIPLTQSTNITIECFVAYNTTSLLSIGRETISPTGI